MYFRDMINTISFTNYKSFKEKQILELKPITILIGKNSSGKSAIAKLPTLIENSLSGNFPEPLLLNNKGVELGSEFRDLIYGRENLGYLEIELISESDKLEIKIAASLAENEYPRIIKWKLNDEYSFTYNDNSKSYFNQVDGEEYVCEFEGFNLVASFMKEKGSSGDDISLRERNLKLNTDYIGPFRSLPPRSFSLKGKKVFLKMGNEGENAYPILASDILNNKGELVSKVNKWYEENFENWGVDVNTSNPPDFKIELTRKSPKFSINIADVGEGMSQALPLVVSAYIKNEDTLTIIEQPELHLHPAAHGGLAELFAKSCVNKKFLIETHSQNFILRLRRLIAEKKLNQNDIAIYSVEYNADTNSSSLKKINLNSLGEVDYWPENVFSEALDETLAIRSAQITRQNDAD